MRRQERTLFGIMLFGFVIVAVLGITSPAGNFSAPFQSRPVFDPLPVLGWIVLLGILGGIFYIGMKRL